MLCIIWICNFVVAVARKPTPHAGFIEFGGENARCYNWALGARAKCDARRTGPLIIMLAITKSHVMGHERVLIRIIYPSHFYVILEERRSRSIHHHYFAWPWEHCAHSTHTLASYARTLAHINILYQQI